MNHCTYCALNNRVNHHADQNKLELRGETFCLSHSHSHRLIFLSVYKAEGPLQETGYVYTIAKALIHSKTENRSDPLSCW